MNVYLNEVERRSFEHAEQVYEALFFLDADEPCVISFEVLRDGKRVPFCTPGIGPAFVRFSVPWETEWDAKLRTGGSAIDMLFEEAQRMVRAQY